MAATSTTHESPSTHLSSETSTLLDKAQLAGVLGLSVRTLEELVASRQFPRGVRIGRKLFWAAPVADTWKKRMFSHQLQWRP